jgi:predicted metal-binding membrane protein
MGSLILRQFAGAPRRLFWLCLLAIVMPCWAVMARLDQSSVLAAICSPHGSDGPPAVVFAMWFAMSLAMMLPAAAPMLSAYLDIAGAAQEKRIEIVSPYLLAAGYASVWMVFSLTAAALQIAVPAVGSPHLAGVLFLVAGVYQFSPLKQACLNKCRDPMATFLAQWTIEPSGILRLGISQGLYCLGCCWALMALAFIAGLMNVIWMAGLAILMLLEKTLPRNGPVMYGTGAGLIAAGVAMIAAS